MIDDSWDDGTSKRRKKFITLGIILFVVGIGILSAFMLTPTSEEEQILEYELLIEEFINVTRIEATIKEFSEKPHTAGTQNNYELALATEARFKEAGLMTKLVEYEVLLTYPLERHVSMGDWSASLTEDILSVDPPTANPDAAPTWNGYSGNGSVVAPVVFVNYGQPSDYAALKAAGVPVARAIHLVRYGRTFRGNKVVNAAAEGAVGVLIYSDPEDDGADKGATYPDGPWRPLSGVQRGSIWVGNGDPTTPSWPSVPGCPRLSLDALYDEKITNGWPLPSIPVQPLSARDATPILQSLQGNTLATLGWSTGVSGVQGVGPSSLVNLTVLQSYEMRSIWNVIGTLRGSENDRTVLLGCHRDAWTMGAGDPISGHSVMLEVATALGSLTTKGWIPRRTLVFASWDGEEYGLIGSTEFAEEFEQKLSREAVVYLNTDIGVEGTDYLTIEGNPQLTRLLKTVANRTSLRTPDGRPLIELWPDVDNVKHLPPLGSGSDYTVFLQRLGIPSLNLAFTAANNQYGAVYHSNYDSYRWYKEFGDPGFLYHGLLAELYGIVAFHLSDEKFVPFHFSAYAHLLSSSLDSYRASLASLGVHPTQLDEAIEELLAASEELVVEETAIENTNPLTVRSLNDRLAFAERTFLTELPMRGRGWYRHLFFAPSLTDSYAAQLFPLLGDAVSAGSSTQAQMQVDLLAIKVRAATQYLRGTLF